MRRISAAACELACQRSSLDLVLQVLSERVLVVWDVISDILVALALWAHHPWWASIAAGIIPREIDEKDVG